MEDIYGNQTDKKIKKQKKKLKNSNELSTDNYQLEDEEFQVVKKKKNVGMIIGIAGASLAVLAIALLLFVLDNSSAVLANKDDYVFYPGVSIEGVNVSGMTYEQGEAMLEYLNVDRNAMLRMNIGGVSHSIPGDVVGIEGNFEDTLNQAFLYGNGGTLFSRLISKNTAKKTGKNFTVHLTLNEEKFKSYINDNVDLFNAKAQDATIVIDQAGTGVVTYATEVVGYDLNVDELFNTFNSKVETMDFKRFEAPCTETQPEISVEELKQNVQLISSYSNSYAAGANKNANRVYNFTRVASIINGKIIAPGAEFSMNETLGSRTEALGWKIAAGLTNGRAEDQPGGGVCQASSCFYVASIEAELEVIKKSNHSWPSNYHPAGLDATISTGSPDLVVKNPYTTPIYIVAWVDTDKMTMNVALYGAPLAHGYTVEFKSRLAKTLTPGADTIIEAEKDPDGNSIPLGTKLTWVQRRDGKVYYVDKIYKDKDGNVVKTISKWDIVTYRAIAGVYYTNHYEEPTPEPSTSGEGGGEG